MKMTKTSSQILGVAIVLAAVQTLAATASKTSVKAGSPAAAATKSSSAGAAKAEGSSQRSPSSSSAGYSSTSTSSYGGSGALKSVKLSVGGVLSLANSMSSDEAQTDVGRIKTKGTSELETTSVIGVTGQVAIPVSKVIEPMAGLTVENTRTFERGSGPRIQGQNIPDSPSYQPWIVHAGAAIRANEYISFPVAVNYTLLNFTRSGLFSREFTMNPDVGYQLGVAARINPNFEVELLQKAVRYNITARNDGFSLNLKGAQISGLNLGARYIF